MKQTLAILIIIISFLFAFNTFIWLIAQDTGHNIPSRTQWIFGARSFFLLAALLFLLFWRQRLQHHARQSAIAVNDRAELLQRLAHLLSLVEEKITDGSDMIWTKYPDARAMRAELATYRQQLEQGDTRTLPALRLLFAPTGSLQEFAMSNGWGREYLELADTFDATIKHL